MLIALTALGHGTPQIQFNTRCAGRLALASNATQLPLRLDLLLLSAGIVCLLCLSRIFSPPLFQSVLPETTGYLLLFFFFREGAGIAVGLVV